MTVQVLDEAPAVDRTASGWNPSRDGPARPPGRPVLVAVDRSRRAVRAAEFGARLART
jgi:hypothetical protein